MCYPDGSTPPPPPVGGATAATGDMHLTARDGNSLMAHFARASSPTGAGMVVLPDVRGLHGFYKQLADRFAEAGIDAVAIDYFGRTAGDGSRDEAFEYMPHVERTTAEGVAADTAAAVVFLRSPEMGSVRSVFTLGFCFGGSHSWNQAAAGHDLAGAIGFYGRPERSRPSIAGMRAPLLLLVAGADFTPREDYDRFDGELTAASVPHRMVVYEGAPHSFFDRGFAEWASACDDAWRQMLDFVAENST